MGEACLISDKHQMSYSSSGRAEDVQHGTAWYAVKVRSGGEAKVMNALQLRGYKPFCPAHQERRTYSDRMKVVTVPLFPGYLFCLFDARHKLPIVSAPGVDYILGSNGPTPIAESEIESIRRMVKAGAKAEPHFARGRRVRVTHGPLQGIEGVLVRDAQGGDKLVVFITLLNQSASVHVNRETICLVD